MIAISLLLAFQLEIRFFDAKHGDAILFRTSTHTVLLDSGRCNIPTYRTDKQGDIVTLWEK